MNDKPAWTSKTIWTNLIAGAALLATGFGVNLGLDQQAQTELVAGIAVFANLLLRFITKTGIYIR